MDFATYSWLAKNQELDSAGLGLSEVPPHEPGVIDPFFDFLIVIYVSAI